MIEHDNAVAVPRLEAMRIRVNDLHSIIDPDIHANICEDMLHLSEAGAMFCAEQVVI